MSLLGVRLSVNGWRGSVISLPFSCSHGLR